MSKTAARVIKFENDGFQPRFEYGDQAQVKQLCGEADGSELGTGFVRMSNARIPWTIKYDEIILVLEGTFSVHINDDVLTANAMDSIWLPAGTELTYVSDDALLFYAIHPSNWSS